MKKLPQRKRNRLQGYDYSQNGAYFITICTKNREHLFGDITGERMKLNENGVIVQTNIERLNNLYDGISVDRYVVMPNHVHMIIRLCRERIACNQVTCNLVTCVPNGDPTKSQIPKIIQVFKSSITKEIRNYEKLRNAYNAFPTIWQSHFHDHIIRDENEYQNIYEYINTNPLKWNEDCFYS